MRGISSSPSFQLEMSCLESGGSLIAGVDEAGRGALAGPLHVGIVLFDQSIFTSPPEELFCITDSKKLSPRKREKAFDIIISSARVADSIAVDSEIVDRLNVNQATLYAIELGFDRLGVKPDAVLLDGNFSFNSSLPLQSVVGGDCLSISIAAASIIAKVSRDRCMVSYALDYPQYGFEKNMGYGTAFHREAISLHGPCPLHRRSYEPVKSYENNKSY